MSGRFDHLPAPSSCDLCCSTNVILTTNDRVFGKTYGDWPHVYFCEDCGASVGCHPNTYLPLGRMTDRYTRKLRARAHEAFDPLWRSGLMTRTAAYNWLAHELNIEPQDCHISWLTREQLKTVETRAIEYYKEREAVLARRKEKRRERFNEQNDRRRKRINDRKSGNRT